MNALLEREDADVFQTDIADPPSNNARAEANRRNAQRSTGPKTVEGKEKSRRNSLKHGLTGEGVVLTVEDEEKLREDVETWSEELQPRNDSERAMIKSLVIARNRLFRGYSIELTMRERLSERAETLWERDQELEVQKLVDKLPKAKTPGLIVAQLKRTPLGCDWLIERWKELDWALDVEKDWNDEARNLAFDLLGSPRLMREFSVFLPFDATLEEKRAIARRNIAKLTSDRDGMIAKADEDDRQRIAAGQFWDDTPEARRFRSYDDKNSKLFHKLLDHFVKRLSAPIVEAEAEPRFKPELDSDRFQEPTEREDVSLSIAELETVQRVLIQSGLIEAPEGSSVQVDPAFVGLSVEELVKAIGPGICTPSLLNCFRGLIAERGY